MASFFHQSIGVHEAVKEDEKSRDVNRKLTYKNRETADVPVSKCVFLYPNIHVLELQGLLN